MELNIFAMPPSTILLLLSAVFRVTSALPWSGPIPTSVYKADEWSPRPTNIPTNPGDLFRRAQIDIAVCGWVGGNEKEPAVCPTGSSCIHDMAHGFVGCCTTSGKCTAGVYTGCVDKNSPGGNTGLPVENNGIYTCQGDSLCYQNKYPRSYSQWACGKTEQATTIAETFIGQPADLLMQVVYTRMTFSPVTLSSTTTSSSSSTSSTATTTTDADLNKITPSTTQITSDPNAVPASPGATGTTSVVEDDSGKSKNKVNGGIVAAGVIGAGAFIIALLAIVLFFLRRRRKQQNNDQSSGGSFMSIKGGEVGVPIGAPAPAPPSPASTQATFPRAVAYSPDDFRTVASTTGASPAMDPSRSVYAPEEYQGIEQRMRENADLAVPPQPYYPSPSLDGDGLPRVSEIDNFSHSFHAAIARMSPPTPPQAQMSNIAPPSPRGYNSRVPEGASGITTGAIAGAAIRRDSRGHGGNGYGPIEDDDYGQQDSYVPGDDYGRVLADNYDPDEYEDDLIEEDFEPINPYDPTDKETGVATTVQAPPRYSPIPGLHTEVRRGEWEPAASQPQRDLAPPSGAVERVSDSTPRYQLVDQPPVAGVPVLHSTGQYRGQNKGARQKQGYDGKNGDDLQA